MKDSELLRLMNEYDAEQRIEEVVWFYRACEIIKPKVIVEIGLKEAGNMKILSMHLGKGDLVIGMDWCKHRDSCVIPWADEAECDVVHVHGNSQDEAVQLELKEVLEGREIDVLFIDGDHSTEGMLSDYKNYSPFVRNGGIIAVHDIYYLPTVTAAWQEVSKGKKDKFESKHIQSSIGIGYFYKEIK